MQYNMTVGTNEKIDTTLPKTTPSLLNREMSNISNTPSEINSKISQNEYHKDKMVNDFTNSEYGKNEPMVKPKNHKSVYDRRNFDGDFESIIKKIASQYKSPSSYSKLPSCAQGINDLEDVSIANIHSMLTGKTKDNFFITQETARGIPEFRMPFERFVICLSALDKGELRNNEKKIHQLVEELNDLFKADEKSSRKYERRKIKFLDKLDKFLSDYLKSSTKDLGDILKINFVNNVFSGEIAREIGHLYNKNNNIDDVFDEGLDGYIEVTKERIKCFNHKNPSLDLEKLLRTNFAFRTILKRENDDIKNPEDSKTPDVSEKNSANSGNRPDRESAKIEGHANQSFLVNKNGIMVNGNNNTISVKNYYYSSGFPMDKFVSVTNNLQENKFSARLERQTHKSDHTPLTLEALPSHSLRKAKNIHLSRKTSILPLTIGSKNAISEEMIALAAKPAISADPIPLSTKSAISDKPIALHARPAISADAVPLSQKPAISHEPIALQARPAISVDPVPLSSKPAISYEAIVLQARPAISADSIPLDIKPSLHQAAQSISPAASAAREKKTSIQNDPVVHRRLLIAQMKLSDTQKWLFPAKRIAQKKGVNPHRREIIDSTDSLTETRTLQAGQAERLKLPWQ